MYVFKFVFLRQFFIKIDIKLASFKSFEWNSEKWNLASDDSQWFFVIKIKFNFLNLRRIWTRNSIEKQCSTAAFKSFSKKRCYRNKTKWVYFFSSFRRDEKYNGHK